MCEVKENLEYYLFVLLHHTQHNYSKQNYHFL